MIDHDLTPQERDELGDLKPLYDRMEAYHAPEPDSAKLLASLKPLLKERTAFETEITPEAEVTPKASTAEGLNPRLEKDASPLKGLPARNVFEAPSVGFGVEVAKRLQPSAGHASEAVRNTRQVLREWLKLVRIQTKLIETPFAWAALLTAGIGLLLSISTESATTMFLLLFVSPLITAGGVAYIFRPATRTLWELEQFSRFHPLETLYARLALILTFNIAMAMALLLVTWTQGTQIVLWRLLLIWLGPMIGLTGLAMFCTVRWGTFAGFIAPTLLWAVITFGGWREAILTMRVELPTLAGFITFISTSNLPLLIAVAGLIGGIALVVESGRQVTRWR